MVDLCAAQVFVPSKDGKVKIPMFIVAKKNVTLDGTSPTFLYAYGGKTPGAVFMTSHMLLSGMSYMHVY